MQFDKRLLTQVWLTKGLFILTLVLGLVHAVLVVIQARLFSIIINRSFLQGQEIHELSRWMIILLVVIILRGIIHFGNELSAGIMAIRVKRNLRKLLLEKILLLGPSYTQEEESGELIAVVGKGIETLDAYFSRYLPQLILAAFIPLIILTSVFPLDLISGIILLLTIPLLPLFMYLIGYAFEKLTSKQWLILRRMSAYFLDSLQGLMTLKTLNQSKLQIGRIAKISDEYRRTTLKVLQMTFLSALVLELTSSISTAIVAVQIGLRLLSGKLGFENAFFILIITPEFYLPLRLLGMRFHAGISGVTSAERIFSILEQPLPEKSPSLDTDREAGMDINSFMGREHNDLCESNDNSPFDHLCQSGLICFDHVSCNYPDRDEGALKGVTFNIKIGALTAFVGKSGAGKTTIARLLLRFIEPKSGRIVVGNQLLSEIPPHQWRNYISWVPQNPHLFHDTLAANILIGNPNADMDQVIMAAKKANLSSDIEDLPLGYDTIIGEGGARLSAGQGQRLALARAFIKDAPIIIMDEPSEHIDPKQEELFRESIAILFRNRTVILIAHSIPTVKLASNIIVMQKGKLIESGSHADLLKIKGVYYQLVKHWLADRYDDKD